MYDNSSRVIEVDINEILPNRFQPRIQFDEEEILELSDSIKEHGVIQPLVVRTIGDKYEIIAGERRYKASVLAGKDTVPVIVKNLNDKDSAEIALIENIQRKNLTPIEEALSYKKILDMGYITQENLASKLGKSQSAVANKIRLLNLSDEVQEALLENKISERHARSLLKLTNSKQQNEMLDRIISDRLTVRRTDEEIEKIKNLSVEDNDDDDNQKIIRKGENDMNNNMFGMPAVETNPQPSTGFDIFGPSNTQSPQPVINTVPEPVQQSVAPSFDIFGGANTTPVTPVTETPIVAPTPVVPEMPTMGGIQFDANGNVVSVPMPEKAPSMPEAQPVTPVMETPIVAPTQVVPEMPTMGGIQFDANGNVVSAPMPEKAPSMPEAQPVTPVVTEIPVTAPIIESPVVNQPIEMTQQSENLFSFGDNNLNASEATVSPVDPVVPEFKMPEPIIVTDYSKQYDPVMPQYGTVPSAVDFKEVINAIRECSSKIEQLGFKIDVEEIDLSNLYQVIFKIEK